MISVSVCYLFSLPLSGKIKTHAQFFLFFPPKGIKLEDEKRRGSIVQSVVHCFCYLELVHCRNQSFSFTLIYGQAGCMNKVSWFLFLDYDNRSSHRGDYSDK